MSDIKNPNVSVSASESDRGRLVPFTVAIFLIFALVVAFFVLQLTESRQISETIDNQIKQTTNDDGAAVNIEYGDGMAMQYAQPWLDKQSEAAASVTEYGDGMAMQYAQPWLDKQSEAAASAVEYGDGMAMQYVQPWLATRKERICNSRLDFLYACRGGYQP